MWVLRFLSGPQAGQTVPLQEGKNVVGRSPQCQLSINNNGISKVHAEINISNGEVTIVDLNSSNGTFINGVRIKSKSVMPSDKMSFHDVLFDIQKIHGQNTLSLQGQFQQQGMMNSVQEASHLQPEISNMGMGEVGQAGTRVAEPQGFSEKANKYIEEVALPGIYKLPEITDFKWVVGGFILCFIFIVTALSVVPMLQITKSSIEKESHRRALTIARNLARVNEAALLQGLNTAVSTRAASLEEGVKTALIISHVDGHIIAPANKSGEYLDKPFIHKARREKKPFVEQIDASSVGASVPITFYNSKAGEQQTLAHAVVLYNMGSLAFDDGRTISLFIQTLLIAIVFGGLLGFFLYKLFEHPIADINNQLDSALKDGVDQLEVKYQFPALIRLKDNLNSLLTRALNGSPVDGGNFSSSAADKEVEAENLLNLMPCPALAINNQNMIIATNYNFESVTGTSLNELKQRGLEAIPDQSFQLSLSDLIQRLQSNSLSIVSNNLEISGTACEIKAQSITGSDSKPAYFVITIQEAESFENNEYDEGAA